MPRHIVREGLLSVTYTGGPILLDACPAVSLFSVPLMADFAQYLCVVGRTNQTHKYMPNLRMYLPTLRIYIPALECIYLL